MCGCQSILLSLFFILLCSVIFEGESCQVLVVKIAIALPTVRYYGKSKPLGKLQPMKPMYLVYVLYLIHSNTMETYTCLSLFLTFSQHTHFKVVHKPLPRDRFPLPKDSPGFVWEQQDSAMFSLPPFFLLNHKNVCVYHLKPTPLCVRGSEKNWGFASTWLSPPTHQPPAPRCRPLLQWSQKEAACCLLRRRKRRGRRRSRRVRKEK